MKFLSCLLLTMILTLPASADVVKIATWNIENLRAAVGVGENPRYAANYSRLREYAILLNADVIALQEIENETALVKIFDPKLYQFFVSTRSVSGNLLQRTAFAVKRTVSVKRHRDLEGLNTSGNLRHGIDIEIKISEQPIRLLAVHLKSGCFDGHLSLVDKKNSHCGKLKLQIPILEQWIDERAKEGTPFFVIGDFNRRFDKAGDEFWPEIDDGEPTGLDLTRATEGVRSECWDSEYPYYIDHIIYDLHVAEWTVPESFEQLLYAESKSMKALLSDHCPIAITLDIPQIGSP